MARVTTRSETDTGSSPSGDVGGSFSSFGFRGDARRVSWIWAEDDVPPRASASFATASGFTAVTSNPHASTTSLSASASTAPGSYVTEADFESRDTETAHTPAVLSSADVTADVHDPHTMPSMAIHASAEAIARVATASRAGRAAQARAPGSEARRSLLFRISRAHSHPREKGRKSASARAFSDVVFPLSFATRRRRRRATSRHARPRGVARLSLCPSRSPQVPPFARSARAEHPSRRSRRSRRRESPLRVRAAAPARHEQNAFQDVRATPARRDGDGHDDADRATR